MNSAALSRKRHKTRHPGVYYRERPDGSRQYCIWYVGTDGKPRFENVPGGERDAVRARARVVDKITRGEKVAPTSLKIKDWAPRWLEERQDMKENTRLMRDYAISKHIIPKLGRYRVCDLNVNHVAGLVSELRKDYSASTINIVLTTLSGLMRTAVRRGYANQNPVGQLDRHERPKGDTPKMNILDTDEIRLLLSSAPKSYHVLLATLIFSGLRVGELCALTWEDVDWDRGSLIVRDSKTRAGLREVDIMPALRKLLAQHSLEHQGTFVFETRSGKPLTRNDVRRYGLVPALEKAGITKHIRVHDLRHTYASILIHNGEEDSYIAEQMGHSSGAFTRKRYGHLFDGEKKRREAKARMEAEFGEVLS